MDIRQTNTKTLPLAVLHENSGQLEGFGVHANPRQISETEYEKLKASLKADDLTGVMPLIVYPLNDEYVILGGNMRARALREMGVQDVSCIVVPGETDAATLEKIIITDNSTFGEWDMDALANWDTEALKDWGVDIPNFIGGG